MMYDELEFEYKGILFQQIPISNKLGDEKNKSRNKKLLFQDKKGLLVTQQSYDNVYYLSQFV